MPFKRILLLSIAALAALVLVAGAAAWLWLQSDAATRRLARELTALTGLPAEFTALDVDWLPTPGLAIQGITLSQPSGFDGPPLLSLAEVRVAAGWGSLLRGRPAFTILQARGPTLRLAQRSDGADNWSALLERLGKMGSEGPTRFYIGEVAIDEAMIEFRRLPAATPRWSVSVFLDAQGVQPAQSFQARARIAGQGADHAFHLKLEGQALLDPDGGRHALAGARLGGWLGGGALPLSGLDFSGAWQLAQVDVAATRAVLEGGSVKVAGVDATLGAGLEFGDTAALRFTLATEEFQPRLLANSLGQPLPDTRDGSAYGAAQLKLSGEFSDGVLALSGIEGRLDDSRFSGEAALGPGSAPPRLRLTVDMLAADRYLPPRAPAATPEATLEELAGQLAALDVDAELRIGELTVRGARLRGVVLRAEPQSGP